MRVNEHRRADWSRLDPQRSRPKNRSHPPASQTIRRTLQGGMRGEGRLSRRPTGQLRCDMITGVVNARGVAGRRPYKDCMFQTCPQKIIRTIGGVDSSGRSGVSTTTRNGPCGIVLGPTNMTRVVCGEEGPPVETRRNAPSGVSNQRFGVVIDAMMIRESTEFPD